MPNVSPSAAPVAKVTAAALGGALATVVILVIQLIDKHDLPVGLEGALAVVFAVIAGYITPPGGAE